MTSTEPRLRRAEPFDRNDRAAYRFRADGGSLAGAIVAAVDELADGDESADPETLYDVVDPDALAQLFADRHDGSPRTGGHAAFELRGCRVEVWAQGDHLVYESAEDRESASGPETSTP